MNLLTRTKRTTARPNDQPKWNRFRAWLIALLFVGLANLPACTHIAYEGPELPADQVATLSCYFRFYLFAITSCNFEEVDGKRSYANTLKLMPGEHSVTLEVSLSAGESSSKLNECEFDFDYKAGYTYKVLAHSVEVQKYINNKKQPSPYKGSLDLRITSPTGERQVQTVEAQCFDPH